MDNWSGKEYPPKAETSFYSYPDLRAVSCVRLTSYSNKFWGAFADTAPRLKELYLHFG